MARRKLLSKVVKSVKGYPAAQQRGMDRLATFTDSLPVAAGLGAIQTGVEYKPGFHPFMQNAEDATWQQKGLATLLNTAAIRTVVRRNPQGVNNITLGSFAPVFASTPVLNAVANSSDTLQNIADATGSVSQVAGDIAAKDEKGKTFADYTKGLAGHLEGVGLGLKSTALNTSMMTDREEGPVTGALSAITESANQLPNAVASLDKATTTLENLPKTMASEVRGMFSDAAMKARTASKETLQSIGQALETTAGRAGLGGLGGYALGALVRPQVSDYDTIREARKKIRQRQRLPLILGALGALGAGGASYYLNNQNPRG